MFCSNGKASDSSSYNMDPPGPGPGSKPRPGPGPAPDSVSMKSDKSKDFGPNFKEARPEEQRPKPAPDSVSMRSDRSKDHPLTFREAPPEDQREPGPKEQLDAIFRRLEKDVLTFVKEQLQRLHRLLASDYPECSESEEEEQSSREVLNITLDFLRRMDQEQLAQRLQHKTAVGVCKDKLKSHLQQRFSRVFEGVAKAGDSAPLNQIYTELYITEGGASEVNQEHEVRLMESASRRAAAPEKTITCEDIFKARPHSPEPIRAVLTKGVAGVGKTVLTQKELNVLRDTQFSLVELLHHFFSPSKALCSFQQLQVLFIFDGLDECRLPLDFSRTRVLSDPTESVSVDVLLVNLIRGSLLPSALLWITTRPAAANQIPAECVSMVTEVRGFTDLQKELYFRKRFTDDTIISHIKSIRSLYIMSHIPVFCWILSTVIQKLLEQTEKPELPQTLTQMYVHFLVVQAKVQNIKYQQGSGADLHWTPETREMVLSLAKLAFEQLQKGNLIFYESDLSECGLDAAAASVYSGVFTQVFREEPGLYQDKVYCFIHLSVQEFLAALHVHQTFTESGVNLMVKKTSFFTQLLKNKNDFYCSAVDQALQSPNGHLDLFLRFLLGLSLPTNQKLLQGLLTQTRSSSETNQETVKYIKQKLNEKGLSTERSLNLLHCLNELNDHSLVEQIQEYVREGLYRLLISPAEWSAVSFVLLSSDSDLEEFDLRKYKPSETALLGLLPVVKASTKALLSLCGLSPHCCGPLASVLSSSSLTHLDLSNNDLQDSGVELLCDGLKSAPCRLETLRLSGCLVSQRGGAALASALSSAHSHLTELDLSYNHPGPSAELLTALRDDPHCPLDSLRSAPGSVGLWSMVGPGLGLWSGLNWTCVFQVGSAGEQWMVPGLRKFFSGSKHSSQKLKLSEDKRTVTRVLWEHQYPDHEDRFTLCPQVLSCTGLRGRCYWEVNWSGVVSIAVSYRGIRRRGETEECEFGGNDQSWILRIYYGSYYVYHNNRETNLSTCFSPSGRVSVLLDSEAGSLSFYDVGYDGKLSHIHTSSCSFTEPLFLGLDCLPQAYRFLMQCAVFHSTCGTSPAAYKVVGARPKGAAGRHIQGESPTTAACVRGFNDLQKELYFRKRFTDDTIISHIKSIRSLYIMSHIPVFCWILSTVIQKLLEQTEKPELPQTLTQMYVHFLVVQAKVQNIKYQQGSGADLHWTPETREMVLSLGKLAFEQLQKGNLIFYESDLSECGLDAAAASVYSGVFTQVFREEPGLYQDKVYCFIHLSVQEFLAALHVHQSFFSSGQNLLSPPHSSESPESEAAFYCSAVDQALQSPNGHLDLFLRFLLGLSLPTNQKLLQGLLTQTGSSSGTNQETVKYIKQKLNEKGLSAERSLNLLHCLNELNDHSLMKEIQEYVRKGTFSSLKSPAQWSAVSFLLLSSDSDLEEFDLRKYGASEKALLGLLPVVKASTKALLCACGLSPHCCGPLASVLSSSSLTHLDLSHNDLQDSGVELLCDGLKSAPCRLETLRLSGCLVSQRGGAALASALSSAHSHLTELDLSYNHPGPSAELLTALRDDPHCPLDSLRLDPAGEQWMVPGLRKYSCEFSLDPNTAHRKLKLSEDKQTVTCVREDQQYPDHEDRFTDYEQVLSCTGLRGRCYWEVDWRGRGFLQQYTVLFSSSSRVSGRVSVLLDSEAGSLSFYDVDSDGKLSHIHTSSCSFTEPLFPGFTLWKEGSSVSVVDLRRAPPAGPL
ncbi:hypothetical protein WMY93_033928 [Mugilogobius chulae]|uniref:B30.2/SPRY domain-containing protein n=1 Tax=Mugilogobius chulae TaxID=88201 RepID=A0AAW0MS25_9GOBI